jgi:SAM-dependent methyltransferase
MPSVNDNKRVWEKDHDWRLSGEEWSGRWHSSYMQWQGSIHPRISTFLPTGTILEIAPGFGRWTRFLKEACNELFLVDLSEKCIEACQKRFAGDRHIHFHVNDGRSLDMIPDESIDLIFSFDSLVHVEDQVIADYVSQFPKKLKADGVVFIHHSNLGHYAAEVQRLKQLEKTPRVLSRLLRWNLLEDLRPQWRALSMTAEKMENYARENGLQCISQECLPWNTKRALIDCISTLVRKDSSRARENRVLQNPFFMQEAENLARLASLYDLEENS